MAKKTSGEAKNGKKEVEKGTKRKYDKKRRINIAAIREVRILTGKMAARRRANRKWIALALVTVVLFKRDDLDWWKQFGRAKRPESGTAAAPRGKDCRGRGAKQRTR